MPNVVSYSSKSTAIRGAKRAGVTDPVVYESEGRWYWSDASEVLAPKVENTDGQDEAPEAVEGEDFADKVKAAKQPTYKQLLRNAKSAVDQPVGFVHQFLAEHPELTRKQAVATLVQHHGINYSTARTQYQRWYSANKKGA